MLVCGIYYIGIICGCLEIAMCRKAYIHKWWDCHSEVVERRSECSGHMANCGDTNGVYTELRSSCYENFDGSGAIANDY